jgi:hemoglobin
MESLLDHMGGEPGVRRFVSAFYGHVLEDAVLQPLFGAGRPEHVDHLTAFTVEVMGGPDRYTAQLGGMPHLAAAHRGLHISDAQRARFIELWMVTSDEVGLPDDEPFRQAWREHVEFGTEVAQVNSRARTEAEMHPLKVVPRWSWPDGS